MDALNDHIAVVDSRGVIVRVNRAWNDFARENNGDSDCVGIGVNYLDVEPEDSDELTHRMFRSIRRVLEGQVDSSDHIYPCHSKEKDRWFRMKVNALPKGGAVVAHADISLLKNQEKELQESANRYRQLAANFPNGAVVLFDHDLRYLLADGKGLREAGLSREQFEGKRLDEIFTSETVDFLRPYYQKALKGESSIFDIPFGKKIYEMRTLPVLDQDGKICHGLAVSRDVTKERKIKEDREREIKGLDSMLKSKSELLRLILDTIPDLVFVKDTEGHYIECNHAMCEFLGRERDRIIGHSDYDFFPPEVARVFRDKDLETIQKRKPERLEEWVDTKNEGRVLYDTVKIPIRMDGNHIEGILGVSRDITKMKEQEKQTLQAKNEAESANQAKSRFLANMSHELRTPLNGLLGLSQLMRDTRLEPEQQSLLDDLQNSGEMLLNIINDILDLSKIESGNIEVHNRDFETEELCEHLNSMFQNMAQKKGLDFSVQMSDKMPIFLCSDDLRIRQVITNLVGNALKFTEKGFVRVLFDSKCIEGQDEILLVMQVEDSGIGIDQDRLDEIFSPFMQVESGDSRRFEGTGLGLAIVRRLVERMGGSVEVSSKPGEGSIFRVQLPVKTASQTVERKREKQKKAPNGSMRCPLDILLVEDNPLNGKVATKMIEKLVKHSVTLAINGKDAVEKANERSYDIIFMDCQMPVMDGYQASRDIRSSSEYNRKTPIVAMTANAFSGDREKCFEAGMTDFIPKPVNFDELKGVIIKLCHYKHGCKCVF